MAALWLTLLLAADLTVFVGTRTRDGRSEGIHRLHFDSTSGALSRVELAAKSIDPSFLAIHPTRRLLYTVVAQPEGRLEAYEIGPGGELKLLNTVSSKGAGPAHIQIDRTGQWVATANYTSGSAAIYRIESDGRLSPAVASVQHAGRGPNAQRQEGPHAHSVNFSADNKLLYIADLGLDEVKVYQFFPARRELVAAPSLKTSPGAGPRHLALGRKRIYVLNELTSTVAVFEGAKQVQEISTLPADFKGVSTAAEVILNKTESVLYASNRGADTIAVFRIGAKLEKIGDVPTGKVPRNFVLSPDGRHMLVASQDEDFVRSYKVDAKTGMLTPLEGTVKVGSPICLRFMPTY